MSDYPRVVRTYRANERIEVRYTEVADGVVVRGVFAAAGIAADTVIEECPVIPMYPDEKHQTSTNLVRGYTFKWPVRLGRRLAVNRAMPLGYVTLYNHSADPNVRLVAYYDDLYGEVVAKRDIATGDELLLNYGWSDVGARFNTVDRFLRPVRGSRAAGVYLGAP